MGPDMIHQNDLQLSKGRLELQIANIDKHIAAILKFSNKPNSQKTRTQIESLKIRRQECESVLAAVNKALRDRFPRL